MKWQLRAPILLVLVCGTLLAGCAKRSTQTPPESPPTPPVTTPDTPAPPTTPGTTTPPAPGETDVVSQLQPAFFDYDSYSLNESGRAALDANARLLRSNSGVGLVVEGHCDERGTAEYNQALGERRAMAAREYLIAAGIDGSRLRVISYGKERPFASGSDEGSWAQNRRAHFVSR